MIGRIASIVAALILASRLYWLTSRAQLLLDRADATLERADCTLAAALAMLATAPSGARQSSAAAAPREEVLPLGAWAAVPMPPPDAPVSVLPQAEGPPTVPTGMALEAEKRDLVERAFSVHGAPRRFTFKASDAQDA